MLYDESGRPIPEDVVDRALLREQSPEHRELVAAANAREARDTADRAAGHGHDFDSPGRQCHRCGLSEVEYMASRGPGQLVPRCPGRG